MFKRLMSLIRGFFGLFLSSLEKNNPEALLEIEKEKLREQMSKYNKGMASHAALCEKLSNQFKNLKAKNESIRLKTSANLKAGNREVAGQYAIRLQANEKELREVQDQLGQSEKTYKDLIAARDITFSQAQKTIEKLAYAINDTKSKNAIAELTEMATGMVSSIGSSGDNINRISEMVEEERNKAAGRARVAKDSLNTDDIRMAEVEQKTLADQALADFAASEGIILESQNISSNKTMVSN